MITRVYIDNFRCFSNFSFEPGRVNLLIGRNGSGKTSFMDALQCLASLIVEGREVDRVFPESSLTRWDTRATQRFEIDVEIGDQLFCYSAVLERKSSGGGMTLQGEKIVCGERTLFRYEDRSVHLYNNSGKEGASFAFRGDRSFLGAVEERHETEELTKFLASMRRLRSYKIEPISTEPISKDEQGLLQQNGANFASWYRHISQEEAARIPELIAQLKEAIPGFCALMLKGAGNQGRTRDLVVQMQSGQQTFEVGFDEISDGQRALIILHTILVEIAASSGAVLLDEPENYVGLAELQPWLHRLDDALGDSGQLFLISHHPEVIDYLAPVNPVLFERPEEGPVRVSPACFDRDTGLRASEQLTRGLLNES